MTETTGLYKETPEQHQSWDRHGEGCSKEKGVAWNATGRCRKPNVATGSFVRVEGSGGNLDLRGETPKGPEMCAEGAWGAQVGWPAQCQLVGGENLGQTQQK